MKHCGTLKLETDRLVLRRYVDEDAGAAFKNWTSDPEVTKFLTWPVHPSEEVSRKVIEDWINRYIEKN